MSRRLGRIVDAVHISKLESGRVSLMFDEACSIADALSCSLDMIRNGPSYSAEAERVYSEIVSMSQRQLETYMYARTVWDGDTDALYEFVRMYTSAPRRYRQEISGVAIDQFDRLVRAGKFVPEIMVDVDKLKLANKKIK